MKLTWSASAKDTLCQGTLCQGTSCQVASQQATSWTISKVILIALVVSLTLAFSIVRSQPLSTVVSIAPQADFVKEIGGDKVSVTVLVPPGSSPATYEPSPKQMAEISEAGIYFRIGVPFEKSFLPRLERMFPSLTIIDTRQGIELRKMENPLILHNEDAHQTHSLEGNLDPHIWLNPRLVKIQAKNILRVLQKYLPNDTLYLRTNFDLFSTRLDSLDLYIADKLAPFKGSKLLVFHPAFGYFADAYGLVQLPIEIEGKEPGAKTLNEIINLARREKIRVIFVQQQFSKKSAEVVAEAVGAKVVVLDPLAENYIANMYTIADKVAEALAKHSE